MYERKAQDIQKIKDAEEIWRYRLSMDKQLTDPKRRFEKFAEKYKAWFQTAEVKDT